MTGLFNSLTGHAANLLARAGSTCNTQVCKDAAKSILNDLDVNVDPCSDFYQYTCGGWIKNTKIPPSEPAVGTFTNLRNANLDGLRQILEGTYDDLLNATRTAGNADDKFITPFEIEKDRNNFGKLQNFYKSCMDEINIDSLGPSPIYPELSKLLGKLGFSASFADGRFTLDNVHQLTEVLIHLGMEGIDNLVSYSVNADDKNPEENSISLNQPSFGLPSREYYEQPEIIGHYRAGLVSIVKAVLGKATTNSASIEDVRRAKMSEHQLSMMNDAEVEAMVDRFIDFESRLAKITLPNEQLQNPIALYNPMTIAELHQKYPIADWLQMLRHLTPNDVSLPKRVIVTAPKYLEQLTNWLVNSDVRDDGITTQNLREYFVVKTIMANVGNVDKDTRELYRDMHSKIASGTTEPLPRSRICVSQTSNTFGQLLGRYFVMKNFGGEPQRQQVAKFMDNIQSSWMQRLQAVDWLDYETRARAVEKVNKLKHKEAYSIVSPDNRSPESLDKYYADIQVDTKNFYANQKSVLAWNMKMEWSKVGQKVDKNEWYMNPHEVNAYYTPTFNEIVLPAGILQSPFYHPELPQYLNYGGIGVVIGHEITHAFDNSGRLYDGDGRLNTWWTGATTKLFDEKSQCFINQYGKFSVDGPNGIKHSVNGKMTLGENLADNGGVNAALMSMKKSMNDKPKENMALPGLENFSPEQLFFINFGRVWCSNMRPEMAVQRVRGDVHSPAKVRVNAAVQNSREFAEAFGCGLKNAMNPKNKCSVW